MTTTKYPPLITRKDIEAIHEANQLNRRVLQAGIRDLVKDVHEGNQQTGQQIKEVTDDRLVQVNANGKTTYIHIV